MKKTCLCMPGYSFVSLVFIFPVQLHLSETWGDFSVLVHRSSNAEPRSKAVTRLGIVFKWQWHLLKFGIWISKQHIILLENSSPEPSIRIRECALTPRTDVCDRQMGDVWLSQPGGDGETVCLVKTFHVPTYVNVSILNTFQTNPTSPGVLSPASGKCGYVVP